MFEFDFEYLEEEESPREKFQPGVFLGERKTDGEGDFLLSNVSWVLSFFWLGGLFSSGNIWIKILSGLKVRGANKGGFVYQGLVPKQFAFGKKIPNCCLQTKGMKIPQHSTPWKINMEPKNGGLEDDLPLQFGDF